MTAFTLPLSCQPIYHIPSCLHILIHTHTHTILCRYAFCYISMYDYSFMDASRAVSSLFLQRGWSAIVNDDIIDAVLLLGHFVIAILCCLFGYLYAVKVRASGANVLLTTMFGFFCGYLMSSVLLKNISSAVSTIYVCFCECPDAFQRSHPEAFISLDNAWQLIYGRGGYSNDLERGSNNATNPPYVPPVACSYSHIPMFDDDSEKDIRAANKFSIREEDEATF